MTILIPYKLIPTYIRDSKLHLYNKVFKITKIVNKDVYVEVTYELK